ncbi:zinc ribbon domain-containing protein [Saccharothrix longispora]|uniref:zinc ribbon domain-containing protein n=1 Tax=Saccharothrix longispora TaxID=33920 RepID=UPI002905DA91|nr:zinc ribbon domain-containing protein [Saccharothrix longispora]
MVIFGLRTKVFVLAMLTLLCPRCGNPAAHALRKSVTKFSLFFVPLFPVSTKHTTQCTFCGTTNRISKEQAGRLARQADGPAPQSWAQGQSWGQGQS